MAEQIGAGACLLGDCYYVGPKATVARLVHFRKQANEQLKLATPDDRRKWQARNAAAWEDATRVETIIQRIAQERDLELHNADRLPFDIWPAYDLPPLSATDQIALVLAGFDCTWTFDPASNQIAIQPMRRD
ncbi:MAG: hypothetical protein GTO41_05980, partial [Burkholderiales bacterium]|nr:hypothetical protein [Burkholderiales bacterium]